MQRRAGQIHPWRVPGFSLTARLGGPYREFSRNDAELVIMSTIAPSASYSLTVRLSIRNKPGMLGRVTSAIGRAGGDIGAVDLVEMTGDRVLRDITIKARDSRHGQEIIDSLRGVAGVTVANISDRTFLMHLGGKIEVRSKSPVRTRDDLSMAYTPGVARVCLAIKEDPARVFTLTVKHNMVAVV